MWSIMAVCELSIYIWMYETSGYAWVVTDIQGSNPGIIALPFTNNSGS